MSGEEPPKLEYEVPGSNRAAVPPEGYLGYRSDAEERSGTSLGTGGWAAVIMLSLAVTVGVLWFVLSLITWKD